MLNSLQYQMSQHQRLSDLRIKLLRLHKLLLETERLTYEQVRGQVSRLCRKNLLRTKDPHQLDLVMQQLEKFETRILLDLKCHLFRCLEFALCGSCSSPHIPSRCGVLC